LYIGDNFSGDYDSFMNHFSLSFTQIWSIFLIIFWTYWLYKIYKTPKNTEII
jgi:hypothetical protein